MLWRFKAALEETFPGSIVEIDCKKINGKMHFSRMFVCIKACVDGFLSGCRPYLGIDSTHLTGKYNGQLVAYAVNKVFKGEVEHRECFRHLMANFRKKV